MSRFVWVGGLGSSLVAPAMDRFFDFDETTLALTIGSSRVKIYVTEDGRPWFQSGPIARHLSSQGGRSLGLCEKKLGDVLVSHSPPLSYYDSLEEYVPEHGLRQLLRASSSPLSAPLTAWLSERVLPRLRTMVRDRPLRRPGTSRRW